MTIKTIISQIENRIAAIRIQRPIIERSRIAIIIGRPIAAIAAIASIGIIARGIIRIITQS